MILHDFASGNLENHTFSMKTKCVYTINRPEPNNTKKRKSYLLLLIPLCKPPIVPPLVVTWARIMAALAVALRQQPSSAG